MYEQVEKPKENKSSAVANSVAQKKGSVKQGFGLVDNRPESVIQRRVQTLAIDSISQSFQKRVNNEALDSSTTEKEVFQRKVIVNDTEKDIDAILDDVVAKTQGRIQGWLVSYMTAVKATKYLNDNLRGHISSLLVKYDTENRSFEDGSHLDSQVIQDVKLVILRLDNIVGIDHHDGQFSRTNTSGGGKALRIYRTTTRTDWNTYLQTGSVAGLLHGHGGALGQALDYFYKSKNKGVNGPLYDNVIFEIKFTKQALNAIDYNEISSGGEGGGPKGGKLTGKREQNDILGEENSFSVNLRACSDLIMSMNPTIRRVDEMKGEDSQYSKRLLELALKHGEYPPQSLTDEERVELEGLRDL
ncbi:hypothetical protein [Celerinatantimonas yamalensis]|uniref:Uncharacterized protein n=1 Tax=Celerinatantimonas yamalensis TaxID=559956 RepID=A0ABW9G746_9GAMM